MNKLNRCNFCGFEILDKENLCEICSKSPGHWDEFTNKDIKIVIKTLHWLTNFILLKLKKK